MQVVAKPLPPRLRTHARDALVPLRRQYRIRGAGGGAGKLGGRNGVHADIRAELTDDRSREVEPRALLLVGIVSDAGGAELGEADDGVGEMRRVGRPSALI